MTFTDRLARFNRRLPNRAIAKVAGRRLSPVALVVHQGRRSGRRYRTPVMPLPLRDGFLVSLPYGPGRDWVRNVLAAGGGSLRQGEGLSLRLVRRPSQREGGLERVRRIGLHGAIACPSTTGACAATRRRAGPR